VRPLKSPAALFFENKSAEGLQKSAPFEITGEALRVKFIAVSFLNMM